MADVELVKARLAKGQSRAQGFTTDPGVQEGHEFALQATVDAAGEGQFGEALDQIMRENGGEEEPSQTILDQLEESDENDADVVDTANATPASDSPAEPEADAWTPPTREEYEASIESARHLQELSKEFDENAVPLLQRLYASLTPSDQRLLLQQIAGQGYGNVPQQAQNTNVNTPAPIPADFGDPDTFTPVEAFAAANSDWIANGPTQVTNYVGQVVGNIEREFATRDEHIGAAVVSSAAANVLIKALAQAVGLEIPSLTPQDVYARLQAQGGTVDSVVAAMLEAPLAKALEKRTRIAAPTPKTIRQGSGGMGAGTKSAKGKSFYETALMTALGE